MAAHKNRKSICIAFLTAVLSFSACSSQAFPSVNDYIHDVDLARKVVKEGREKYEAEVGRLAASDPQAMIKFVNTPSAIVNASQALAAIATAADRAKPFGKCFGKEITTATTDHACLDAAGYKR